MAWMTSCCVSLLRCSPEHDPEKACPGLDPGWRPVFGKDHAQKCDAGSACHRAADASPPPEASVDFRFAYLALNSGSCKPRFYPTCMYPTGCRPRESGDPSCRMRRPVKYGSPSHVGFSRHAYQKCRSRINPGSDARGRQSRGVVPVPTSASSPSRASAPRRAGRRSSRPPPGRGS